MVAIWFYQAIKSQEIWRDCTIDQEDVSNIYNEFTKDFFGGLIEKVLVINGPNLIFG